MSLKPFNLNIATSNPRTFYSTPSSNKYNIRVRRNRARVNRARVLKDVRIKAYSP